MPIDPFIMKLVLLGCLAVLTVVLIVILSRTGGRTVALDVEFKLTDIEYKPLAGVPVRLVFGLADWQAPDAGTRIVTATNGAATFTTQAVIDRRWSFSNIGFTPFSVPFRADHIAVGAELAFAIPKKDGDDTIHYWLYTADIDRLPDGDCSTDDLDKVYETGADGRFSKLVGRNASGPNFHALVDGWMLANAGYQLWDFELDPDGRDNAAARWHLKLAIKRMPKPQLR